MVELLVASLKRKSQGVVLIFNPSVESKSDSLSVSSEPSSVSGSVSSSPSVPSSFGSLGSSLRSSRPTKSINSSSGKQDIKEVFKTTKNKRENTSKIWGFLIIVLELIL